MKQLELVEKLTIDSLLEIMEQWEKDYEEDFNDYFTSSLVSKDNWLSFLKTNGFDTTGMEDEYLESCMPYDEDKDYEKERNKNLRLVSEYYINNKKILLKLIFILNNGEWVEWWNTEIEHKL